MAAVRRKAAPKVGSKQWVQSERDEVLRLADQDAEDFFYTAKNELEWLRGHMAQIFDENQM